MSLCISSYSADEPISVDIKEDDEWHYFKGKSDPPDKWNYRNFDDSTWQKGASGFGYGIGKHNTLLNDMKGKYKSIYVRREFMFLIRSI